MIIIVLAKDVYIPSVDAKDLYIANNLIKENPVGYDLTNKQGEYNLRKFINSFDSSLDLNKLYDIYYKIYRRNGFSFKVGPHEYSSQVINVTFKYANKEFNHVYRNTYVKFGYDVRDLIFEDCVAFVNDELVGIILNEEVLSPVDDLVLNGNFKFENGVYTLGTLKTITSRFELRNELYKNGFYCDGIHYVRLKRSSGSARVGKCLFVNEALYKRFHLWEVWGLDIKDGQEIDLAAFESYISLSTSSIIDTLTIDPKSILIIDDYDSVFTEEVVATSVLDGRLHTEQKEVTISNSIWDGQSLIDKSVMGKYKKYGMVLLRNGFFKSCCFNTNIQKWFKDNNITDISQLNGFTLAKSVEDIKLITTPNSIKYLKFGTKEKWLSVISEDFGIVKHDKKTHYFEGKLVQTHYQLLSTLQMNFEETQAFLQPSLDFIDMLHSDPAAVRYHIKYPMQEALDTSTWNSKNDAVFTMMGVNDQFYRTKFYYEFLKKNVASVVSHIKRGHVLVNGNYSTLLGNPLEMLQQSIGVFKGESQLGVGNIHSTRFDYNIDLLGSRSPHVAFGNILVAHNVANELIDKYFNLTEEIVCINSIGENILQRLSGADFDSDTMLLTDNKYLLRAAIRNYHRFKVPTSLVEAKKTKRFYTPEQQADLDIKTSVNKIGEIINFSQVLNNLYWNNIAKGQTHEENHELYCDIAQLDVMSGIEIDKAKKEFIVDNTKELNALRAKYSSVLTDEKTGKKIQPHFFAHIGRLKGYYNSEKILYKKHDSTMDYVQTIMNSYKRKRSCLKHEFLPFVTMLDKNKFRVSDVNHEQIDFILNMLRHFNFIKQEIWRTTEDIEICKREVFKNKENMVEILSNREIGYSTMYVLLSLLDKDEYSDIRTLMLTSFFETPNNNMLSVLKESQQDLEILYQDINGTIKIHGISFNKIQKSCEIPLETSQKRPKKSALKRRS